MDHECFLQISSSFILFCDTRKNCHLMCFKLFPQNKETSVLFNLILLGYYHTFLGAKTALLSSGPLVLRDKQKCSTLKNKSYIPRMMAGIKRNVPFSHL